VLYLSTRTERSIIPKLEEDELPEGKEEFEEEIKDILRPDVESQQIDDQELVYEFEEETEEGAEYVLSNEEELELDSLPGMETVEDDFTVTTEKYSGIDRVGVESDGSVTMENSAGMEETYLLAGAYQGQAIIKDDNGLIWRYNSQEEELLYRSTENDEWIESDSEKHRAKFEKVVDFQQQLWALNRARNDVQGWNHSKKDKGKRDILKSRFDTVMEQLTFSGKYEANETATRGGAARGEDVVKDFQEASKRFRSYGLLEYGIDALNEVEVAGDKSEVTYSPREF
jgi:hypothetical protein